jgi:hypothetical protein
MSVVEAKKGPCNGLPKGLRLCIGWVLLFPLLISALGVFISGYGVVVCGFGVGVQNAWGNVFVCVQAWVKLHTPEDMAYAFVVLIVMVFYQEVATIFWGLVILEFTSNAWGLIQGFLSWALKRSDCEKLPDQWYSLLGLFFIPAVLDVGIVWAILTPDFCLIPSIVLVLPAFYPLFRLIIPFYQQFLQVMCCRKIATPALDKFPLMIQKWAKKGLVRKREDVDNEINELKKDKKDRAKEESDDEPLCCCVCCAEEEQTAEDVDDQGEEWLCCCGYCASKTEVGREDGDETQGVDTREGRPPEVTQTGETSDMERECDNIYNI